MVTTTTHLTCLIFPTPPSTVRARCNHTQLHLERVERPRHTRFMVNQYVVANTDEHNHGPNDHDIGRVRDFFQERITEVRKRSQLSVQGQVQQKLLGHRFCLPTEKAVLSNRPEFSISSPDLRQKSWLKLNKFCTLEYWNRLWIVQEIILARDLVLQSRNTTIRWATFADILLCLKYTSGQTLSEAGITRRLLHAPAAELVRLRREYIAQSSASQKNIGLSLSRILVDCRHTRCHDPRDKICGLMGLAQTTGLDLYPDYSRTTSEIYEEPIKRPNLWRSDQLVWFSSMHQ
jgi:hypothetical protein